MWFHFRGKWTGMISLDASAFSGAWRGRRKGGCALPDGDMMKKRIFALFCALLMLLGLVSTAGAESTVSTLPIKVELDFSKYQFTAPEEITVTIRVTNVTDEKFTSPVSVLDPNGSIIEAFGTPLLDAGASQSCTIAWNVTQADLNAGQLAFRVRYPRKDENGIVSNASNNFVKRISQVQAEPEIQVSRTITPGIARKGQEVSVVYEIRNVGTVDVTGVRIKESSAVSSNTASIGAIPAGEKKSHTFTVTMGTKNITSNATVTYSAGGKSYTEKVADAAIKYGTVNLTATLTADRKGGNVGDEVKLTLTLKNTGKKNITGITVTDPTLNTVFTDVTVEAGKTVKLEKTITMTETAEYQFTVTGMEGKTGIETATGRLPLTAIDPAKAPSLTVETTASTDVVFTLPSVIRFTTTVTNTGNYDAKNITVSSSGVSLANIALLAPGESFTTMRDVQVNMVGKFRFDATLRNELDEATTFEGNIIQVQQAAPTSVPTQVPVTTPQPFVAEELPTEDTLPAAVTTFQGVLTTLYYIFAVLAVISAVLLAVSIAGRVMNRPKDGQEQLQLSERRNYTEEVPEDERVMIADESENAPEAEEKPETAEAADTVQTADDVAANEKPASAEAQQVFTADDMAEDGDAMEDAKAQIYGRSKRGRQ